MSIAARDDHLSDLSFLDVMGNILVERRVRELSEGLCSCEEQEPKRRSDRLTIQLSAKLSNTSSFRQCASASRKLST